MAKRKDNVEIVDEESEVIEQVEHTSETLQQISGGSEMFSYGLGEALLLEEIGSRIFYLDSLVTPDTFREVTMFIVKANIQDAGIPSDERKPIKLVINSPGGSVTAGWAIYDTMQYISCDVSTICMGQAASMAAILLAGGTKGKRCALPSSRVMIHQPRGGVEGQESDISILAKEIIRLKKLSIEFLSNHTKKPIEEVAKDIERDYFMSANDALEYGIIDQVMQKRK